MDSDAVRRFGTKSEPGRKLFFRIERTGPPVAARPVTSSRSIVHVPPTHGSNRLNKHGSRPPLGPTDTPVLLRLSHTQLLTLRLGLERGMYRGLCCAVGPAIPPPTPTPAHGTHCLPSPDRNEQACGA